MTSILFFLIIATSCTTDDLDNNNYNPSEEQPLTLEFILPENQTPNGPRTYAMAPSDENKLNDVTILVFKHIAGVDEFYYKVEGENISNTSPNGSTQKFRALLRYIKADDEQHRLVVIANTDATIPAIIAEGTPKEEVLKQILFASTGIWNAKEEGAGSGTFKPFPMWGESTLVQITHGISPEALAPINLLRANARIDVGINYNGAGIAQGLNKTFMMEKVYVFNSKDKGYAAPLATANFDGNRVDAPSIPTGTGTNAKLEYTTSATDKYDLSSQIYIVEAEAVALNDWENATGLVIGGRYSNNPTVEEPTEISYYRLDIVDTDDNYRDILRNHNYRISITSVSGKGWPTPEAAWVSRNSEIEAEILVWDLAPLSSMEDGHWVLRSEANMRVSHFASNDNAINVFTNCVDGWKVEVDSITSPWLHVRTLSGVADVWGTIGFAVDANGTALEREAEVKITAGRMTKVIKIFQDGGIPLNVRPWEDPTVADPEAKNYSLYIDKGEIHIPRGIPGALERKGALAIIPSNAIAEPIKLRYVNSSPQFLVTTDYSFGFRYGAQLPIYTEQQVPIYDWTGTVSIDPADQEWLELVPIYQGTHSMRFRIGYKSLNSYAEGATRTGKIYVKLGNLRRTIYIKQDIQNFVVPKGSEYFQGSMSDFTTESLMVTSGSQKVDSEYNWTTYMNIPYNYIGTDFDGNQINPPVDGSCAQLNHFNFMGKNDWRLPNTIELMSIFTYVLVNRGYYDSSYSLFTKDPHSLEYQMPISSHQFRSSEVYFPSANQMSTISLMITTELDDNSPYPEWRYYYLASTAPDIPGTFTRCVRTAAELD